MLYGMAWLAVSTGLALVIGAVFFGYGVEEITKEEYEEFLDQHEEK